MYENANEQNNYACRVCSHRKVALYNFLRVGYALCKGDCDEKIHSFSIFRSNYNGNSSGNDFSRTERGLRSD